MKMFKISHDGEVIGYCFAKTAASAIEAFRKAHNIPAEICLGAAS